MANIKVTKTDGNWIIGTIEGIKFNLKAFTEDSEQFGLNGGNISILWIDGIAHYSRGWDEEPKTKRGAALVRTLVRTFTTDLVAEII